MAEAVNKTNTRVERETQYTVAEMETTARRLRRDIVMMLGRAGSGHPGGSLSAVEIISSLYLRVMQHNPGNPHWPDRDRFVVSKGHSAPALYAVLVECGYLPKEELSTLRQLGSRLQGHITRNLDIGIEMSSGSLGQGLSFGIGIALAGRLDSRQYRVYVLLGDGECNEGSTWEAVLFAGHHNLDNLIAIIDYNKIQAMGSTRDIMDLDPFADKWKCFGWAVHEVDGHNLDEIETVLGQIPFESSHPSCVIAHTVKGKGVSFMENDVLWHYRSPHGEEFEAALKELEETR